MAPTAGHAVRHGAREDVRFVVLLRILTYLLALTSLGLGGLLYCRLGSRLGLVLWPFKMLAGPLAGFTAVGGALAALLGLALAAPLAVGAGSVGALLSALYLWRVTRRAYCRQSPALCRLERDAAAGWAEAARPGAAGRRRPRWERDLPFWSPPDSGRPLLCDVWSPPEGVRPSGLALVYLHSSSWHLADKDVWTRPLFDHLARQGHVVMDVAYRLCPEVGLPGMLGDAKRAIAWMKTNAPLYGADPRRVVAMGASAGGQLALLAAYAPGHPALTPPDLTGVDTEVCAVVSYYGLADMRAFYARAEALLPRAELVRKLAAGPLLQVVERAGGLVPGRPIAGQAWKLAGMSNAGMMESLLGGPPERVPAMYDLASPITHAGPLSPPTLLIHGEHDTAVPVCATHVLYEKLVAAGVPAACVILPQTDHIFDLVLPRVSPPGRSARAALDRFLRLLATEATSPEAVTGRLAGEAADA
jgi:acetyl esterase/lipase